MKIVAAKKLLKANDQLAAENRAKLDAAGVLGVNLVGSPGCGKTTLLEGLFAVLKGASGALRPASGAMRPASGALRPAVIEGDIAGSIDAQRIAALNVPVVQINTDGACHLDAAMIAAATTDLDYQAIDLLVIENVGNLVCTAGFDLGEHVRIAVLSVTEGDDKIVKYPAIFQGSDLVVITKSDLAPLTNFRAERVVDDVRRLNPEIPVLQVSALKGDGIPELAQWLVDQRRVNDQGE